jgi:hypothetical protein
LGKDPFDVQKRIQELRSYLDPNSRNYQPEQQHINIKAAIKLYEDGKIDGMEQVSIKDGKIVPKEEIFKGPSMSMCEGRFHQFAEKHAYTGTQSWRTERPTAHGTIVMNDTDSDMLTLFNVPRLSGLE